MRWRSLIPFMLCLALQPLWSSDPVHQAAKADAAKNGAATAKSDKTNSDAAKPDNEEGFDVPVPLGIPVKGIKIPRRNEAGKLVMTIEAEVATKLDEQHIEMQNMKIESFDDDGKKVNIELPHSVFNLETRVLTGDSHAFIHREDFEITGDSLEFNVKTRNATMRGKVRMVIDSAHLDQ